MGQYSVLDLVTLGLRDSRENIGKYGGFRKRTFMRATPAASSAAGFKAPGAMRRNVAENYLEGGGKSITGRDLGGGGRVRARGGQVGPFGDFGVGTRTCAGGCSGTHVDLLCLRAVKSSKIRENYPSAVLEIGLRVRALREKAGLTQADLASRLKVSQQVVLRLESGEAANPTVTTLERIAKATGHHLRLEFEPA